MKQADKQGDPVADLIDNRLPDEQALAVLAELSPDAVTLPLMSKLIQRLRDHAEVLPGIQTAVLDCCGTGGSGVSTFNTSTAAAFVAASVGIPVMKFGNRALSSASGSFDFLEALGIPLLPLPQIPACLAATRLVFLSAPQVYPSLAPLSRLRRKYGKPTIFNFLGPLLHPYTPQRRLIGVSYGLVQDIMAEYLCLHEPGLQRALLVCHESGLDEIGPTGQTCAISIALQGTRAMSQVETLRFSSPPFSQTHAQAPPPARDSLASAALFQAMTEGNRLDTLEGRMLCLNAGACLMLADWAASIEEGAAFAEALLRDGTVKRQLLHCRAVYHELAQERN